MKRFSGHPLCYCSSLPDSTCDFCSGLRKGTPDDYRGVRIYYTGDMANCDSFGTIVEFIPQGKYNPESVRIKYDSERFEGDTRKESTVYCIMFKPGPGRRFWPLSEWEHDRKQKIAEMTERFRKGAA